MAHRGIARVVAPLALVAFVIALLMVISASGDHTDSGTSTKIGEGSAKSQKSKPHVRATKSTTAPKYYTVQPNDSFSTIAAQNGVSTDKIQELNPDLDPQLLSIGDRIRLR